MAASCNFPVVFIVLLLALEQGQCMEFDITPRKATESVTKQVTLTCRTDKTREVVLIQISRGDDESVAMIRGNGKTISYGNQGSRRFEAVGEIKEGYLNVTMHFPSNGDSGIYKCHVVYLGDGGVASYHSNEAYLDTQEFHKVAEKIQALEAQLNDAKISILKMNASLLTKAPVVAFSATISRRNYSIKEKQSIVFDEVIMMLGSCYNNRDGTFTAPVDGLYAFSLVLEAEGKAGAGFSLQINPNRELARLYVEDKDVGDQSSVSSVTILRAGEKVKVTTAYKTKDTGLLYHNKYSVFSGYLITTNV